MIGRLKERDIIQRLEDNEINSRVSGYTVCVVEFSSEVYSQKKMHKFMIHSTIFLRPIFKQKGFSILATYENNKIICIILDYKLRETWKDRMMSVINQSKIRWHSLPKECQVTIGVGRMSDLITEVNKNFQTAQEAVNIQKRINREEPLYDSLNIFRLVSQTEKMGNLSEYIQDYLVPVMHYDQEHNTELLKTLQAYCECNGSKQKTAERLFIVRQTLYLRIQKLEELLGVDFMLSEKRLVIEFALHAYQFREGGTTSHKS